MRHHMEPGHTRAFNHRYKGKHGYCEHCGVYRKQLQRDHIISRKLGGTDLPNNIQYLCANCHEDKSKHDVKTIRAAAKGALLVEYTDLDTGETVTRYKPRAFCTHLDYEIEIARIGLEILSLQEKQAVLRWEMNERFSPEQKEQD